jgi:DNA-binding transcriptional ArsR family regulator
LSISHRSRVGEQPKQSAPIFAALGDETRLLLISRLCDDGPMSITRLTKGTNVTRQAITKHLEVMRKAGLVRNTRRGRERIWQLEQRQLKEARHCLEFISKQWDDALGRLKKFVEE